MPVLIHFIRPTTYKTKQLMVVSFGLLENPAYVTRRYRFYWN